MNNNITATSKKSAPATTSTMGDKKLFLDSLIKSGKLPGHIKTVEEALTIAQMGKELGFPTMQAFHYIIPIQGRLSLSAKAIGAILRKGNIHYTTKEDALFVYSDGTTWNYVTKPGLKPGDPDIKAIDRRTTLIFDRKGVKEEVSFTWKDAEAQGLTTKDNWKRMPKEMLFARCISKGANRIGPDLLLGLYMTDELTDSFNVKESSIKRDEDGTVTTVDAEAVEVKM